MLHVIILLQESARIPRSTLKRAIFWVLSFVVPGLGMFSEAYWVFSVGNLKGIFQAEYNTCWKKHTTCSGGLINSLTYTTVHFQHCIVNHSGMAYLVASLPASPESFICFMTNRIVQGFLADMLM